MLMINETSNCPPIIREPITFSRSTEKRPLREYFKETRELLHKLYCEGLSDGLANRPSRETLSHHQEIGRYALGYAVGSRCRKG